MPDETRKEGRASHGFATLAGVLIAFLLLAAGYVLYQAMHVLFPQNVYETALPAVISDTVDADGVLLFDESYVAGSGNLGYLAADGERVSAGTAVAEIYSNASQATLRQQLIQLNDQIDLLQRSQNTAALQLDSLLKERAGALYDLLDTLDDGDYEAVDDDSNAYQLAQNKLWVVTGDAANFTDQITALVQQAQSVQAQLGSPTQIAAPQTGYFVRASGSGRLNAGADDILALSAQELQGYLDSDPVMALDGCAGKIVAGFTWRYVGVCSAKQGEKLLGQDGNIGGKTGTTDDAGYCFTGAYNRDGDETYTVVLNSSTTDQRFADTAALANWYYGHKVTVAIANTQEKTANGNPLIARISQTDWTDKTIDATLADPAAQATVFSLAGEVTEKVTYDDLSGTVHVGDKVGSVTLKQDGTKITVMDLVADEEGSGPNPIEWLLVKLDRLGRRIDNRPLTAESETVAKAPEV